MKMSRWGILCGLELDVDCGDVSKFSTGGGFVYSGLSVAYDTTGRVAALNHLRNSIAEYMKATQSEHEMILNGAREAWKSCK